MDWFKVYSGRMEEQVKTVYPRRAEYAESTRRAIVDAARDLFSRRGYTATRVDDIAAAARVSPATVYTAGGKQGLLHTLVEAWTAAPIVEATYQAIAGASDQHDVLRILASAVREMRGEWSDVMKIVIATAPLDDAAAAALSLATERYRAGMVVAARRLADFAALKTGLSVDDAVDILWFHFGYSGFFTLVDDNGWTLDRAEGWLRERAEAALLGV